jgi:hypothetical protein
MANTKKPARIASAMIRHRYEESGTVWSTMPWSTIARVRPMTGMYATPPTGNTTSKRSRNRFWRAR